MRLRRWLRFRLSTILILTAILAWAMAIHPLFQSVKPGYKGRFIAMPAGSHFIAVVPHPNLKWPALALAVFLTWKAAWAVVERRRARRITAPPSS